MNEIYEAKLERKDKISHGTNEYEAIEFITQKYVEKKWMKKKKVNKKKNKSKPKKYQQRKKNIKKERKLKDDERKSDPSSIHSDLLNFNEENKTFDNDTPVNWVKFTENEDEDEIDNDKIPSLLDVNEMQNFAFSDLAHKNLMNDIDQKKIDKSTILSMYKINKNGNDNINHNNINPMIMQFNPSPFPKKINYNPLNQNININMNHMNNMDNNVKQSMQINDNPFRIDSNNMNNMDHNVEQNDNPFRIDNNSEVKFDPFNHINDLCANNGDYVYNSKVSC